MQKIQRCCKCDEPTGRCEDDALIGDDGNEYCEKCFDEEGGFEYEENMWPT